MEVMNFHSTNLTQQCLVCAADSLTNYVDLTLVTSQTSQSETPVEDKLKSLLNEHWREPDSDMALVICLPCFQTVDQVDSLELQLQNLKKDLTEKYVGSYGRDKLPPPEKAVKHRKRRGRPPKASPTKPSPKVKAKPKPKQKRSYNKRKKSEADDDDDDKDDSDDMWVGDDGDVDTSSAPGPSQKQLVTKSNNENGTKARNKELNKVRMQAAMQSTSEEDDDRDDPHQNHMVPQPPPEPEKEENKNVYDDDPALLNPGERLRMGQIIPGEAGNISYSCAYCLDVFPDIGMLKAHVRVRHRPEVLTTLLPAELGLGSKVNCGMQLEGVTSPTEQGRPFVCIFCDGAFKFKSNVLLHYKEKHTPHKPFSCVDCKECFRRSMELSRHRVYYCPFRKRKVPRKPGREPKAIKKE